MGIRPYAPCQYTLYAPIILAGANGWDSADAYPSVMQEIMAATMHSLDTARMRARIIATGSASHAQPRAEQYTYATRSTCAILRGKERQ